MKATNSFEEALLKHLESFAEQDSVFAKKFRETTKTLSGCANYVCNEARKYAKGQRAIGIEDAVVYGWAVHYFEEDSVKEETKSSVSTRVASPNQTSVAQVGGDLSVGAMMASML